MNGCIELADICDQIVEANPNIEAAEFLTELGHRVAGIDPGVEGVVDLARGGTNKVWGVGFRPDFDDGSNGQARHFAGTAASVERFGANATEFVAHTFLDQEDSADGRLSTKAIEFAQLLLNGDLEVASAGEWIRAEICDAANVTDE